MVKRKNAAVEVPAKPADPFLLSKVPGKTLTPLERRRLERHLENEELKKHEARNAKRRLPKFARFVVFLIVTAIGIDHYVPWEKLIKLGPGYSGRVPLTPAEVTPPQPVPSRILTPSWAPGANVSNPKWNPTAAVHDEVSLEAMRAAGDLVSRALGVARDLVKEGVTTDEIDRQVHQFIVSHDAYPSPLRFKKYPKSVCTSVNEVMVHGVPDTRPLQNGDIVNVDVTVYYGGLHADTSATFQVGDVTESARDVMAATRESLEAAVRACGPGRPLINIGKAVQAVADAHGMRTVRAFIGHGIGSFFHGKPRVYAFYPTGWWDLSGWLQLLLAPDYWHVLEPGTTFTIEPILIERGGSPRFRVWPDGWTVSSMDGSLNAQYEYTVVVQESGTGEGQGGCEVLTPYVWETRGQ